MYSVGVCIQTIESVLPAGLGLDVLDLVPSLLGHMLGDQGVGGLDDGELSRHDYCLFGPERSAVGRPD